MLKRFFVEEEGQTLIEYGLLLSLAVIIGMGVTTLMELRR